MIHCKRNRQKQIEWHKIRTAVRKVLQRKANLAFRNSEASRLKADSQHPWAAFLSREKNFHSDEVYNLDVATVLFLAPRIRLLVKGGFEKCGATPYIPELHTDNSHDNWEQWHAILKKIQYAFDTLEKKIQEYPDDSLRTIFDDRLTEQERKKVQSGLNSFARNLKDMEY